MRIRRRAARSIVAGAFVIAAACVRPDSGESERHFREGRWFELRDAVSEQSPDILRAAVATAFNDTGAAEARARTYDSIALPELAFTIGSKEVTLRPASVTLQRLELLGGECCVGNAGHDLLVRVRGFSIDFSRMTVIVH